MKKYDILYMDPPWSFNSRKNTSTKFGGGAMRHYKTMTMQQIKDLDYSVILNDNALVYSWVVLSKLPECLKALERQDVKFSTTGFVWVKINSKLHATPQSDEPNIYIDGMYSKPFFGVGNYTASNAEICVILKKGKMVKYDKKVSQIILSPREEHSKKPKIVRDRLEEMYPSSKYNKIEFFSRSYDNNFDMVGNQLNNTTVEDFINDYKSS